MCGHVGIAGKLEFKDEALLKKLLVLDYFRGPDSTGLASIRKNGDVKIAKMASHPLDLFDTKRFSSALGGFQSIVLLGHNRLATKGVVNNENAHPYQYGHIVGAHNGTLDKASWEALQVLAGEETNVDSQAVFAAIAKVGIEETIKHMTGAWALVWVDLEEGTLNFLRNKERPFWYCYDKSYDRIMYASEWEFLLAATQTGPSASQYELARDNENNRFFQTKENWLYSFKLEDLKAGMKTRPSPLVKELKGKEVVVTTTSNFHGGSYRPNHQTMGPNTTITTRGTTGSTTPHTPTTTSSNTTQGNILTLPSNRKVKIGAQQELIELPGTNTHPFGGYMTEAEFDLLAKYGCTWCQADISYGEIGVTIHESTDTILCPECSGNNNSNRVYCANQH